MKKIILILLIFLTSCQDTNFLTESAIEEPDNISGSISGEWIVKEVHSDIKNSKKESKDHLGERIFFSENLFSIVDDFQKDPKYRVRKVNLSDYLMRFYNIQPVDIGLDEDKVFIISAYGDNKLPYEFVKISDKKMLLYNNGNFLILEKGRDEVAYKEIWENINIERMASKRNDIEIRKDTSAILIGIRSSDEDKTNNKYQTLLLTFSNNKINEILYVDSLIRSVRRGYMKVDIKKTGEDLIESETVITSVIGSLENIVEDSNNNDLEVNLPVIELIDYVGRDYISIRRLNYTTGGEELRVLKIDAKEGGNYVDIKDILGKSVSELINISGLKELDESKEIILSDINFGIRRHEGSWKMFARVILDEELNLYEDVLIEEDKLRRLLDINDENISWSAIKGIFPDIEDAFSSPRGDLFITKNRELLEAYPVENKIIMDRVLLKLELPKNSKIVMSEWFLGNHEELYDLFQSIGAKKIDY